MSGSTRNEVIQETIQNIKSDRDRIISHISTISSEIKGEEGVEKVSSTRMAYKDMGPTLVKMFEGLQRTNEQLIKVAGVMQKEVKLTPPDEEEDFDSDEIYENLEEEKNNGKESSDDR